MFSSDYPHVEGGRKPLEHFAASMAAAGTDHEAQERFYSANFLDLMGTAGLAWRPEPAVRRGPAGTVRPGTPHRGGDRATHRGATPGGA